MKYTLSEHQIKLNESLRQQESCYEIDKRFKDIWLDNDKTWDNDSVLKLLGWFSSYLAFQKRGYMTDEVCQGILDEIKELRDLLKEEVESE